MPNINNSAFSKFYSRFFSRRLLYFTAHILTCHSREAQVSLVIFTVFCKWWQCDTERHQSNHQHYTTLPYHYYHYTIIYTSAFLVRCVKISCGIKCPWLCVGPNMGPPFSLQTSDSGSLSGTASIYLLFSFLNEWLINYSAAVWSD